MRPIQLIGVAMHQYSVLIVQFFNTIKVSITRQVNRFTKVLGYENHTADSVLRIHVCDIDCSACITVELGIG